MRFALVATIVLALAFAPIVSAAADDITPSTFTGESSAWVKLCDGQTCKMEHSRYDARSGEQVMYIILTQYEGSWAGNIAVSTSLQSSQSAGIDLDIYAPGPWAEMEQSGSTPARALFNLHLDISHCTFGCFGSTRASKKLVAALKKGGGLIVRSVGISGEPIVFKIPLTDFADVQARPPFDYATFNSKREELLASLRMGGASNPAPALEPPPLPDIEPPPPGPAALEPTPLPAPQAGTEQWQSWFDWRPWRSKKPAKPFGGEAPMPSAAATKVYICNTAVGTSPPECRILQQAEQTHLACPSNVVLPPDCFEDPTLAMEPGDLAQAPPPTGAFGEFLKKILQLPQPSPLPPQPSAAIPPPPASFPPAAQAVQPAESGTGPTTEVHYAGTNIGLAAPPGYCLVDSENNLLKLLVNKVLIGRNDGVPPKVLAGYKDCDESDGNFRTRIGVYYAPDLTVLDYESRPELLQSSRQLVTEACQDDKVFKSQTGTLDDTVAGRLDAAAQELLSQSDSKNQDVAILGLRASMCRSLSAWTLGSGGNRRVLITFGTMMMLRDRPVFFSDMANFSTTEAARTSAASFDQLLDHIRQINP